MAFGYKIYFSDRFRNRVLCWNPDTDESMTVAGETEDSRLKEPYGLAVDSRGCLLIASKFQHSIYRMKNGHRERIDTYDPDGHRKCKFYSPQNNPECPTGIFYEDKGTLLVSYSDDHTIYRIHHNGKLELVLGIPIYRYYEAGGYREYITPENTNTTPIFMPTGIVARKDGTIFFIERGYNIVREYNPKQGLHSFFPFSLRKEFERIQSAPHETDVQSYYSPYPLGLAINDSSLFLADGSHRCVFEINLTTKQMKRVMQTPSYTPQNQIGPVAITIGPDRTLWVLDGGENQICGFQKNKENIWQKVEASFPISKWEYSCSGKSTGMTCF